MGLSNYPPGVTGNESAITGEWSADELNDKLEDAKKAVRDAVEDVLGIFDDQGAAPSREQQAVEDAMEALLDDLGQLELQTEPDYDAMRDERDGF